MSFPTASTIKEAIQAAKLSGQPSLGDSVQVGDVGRNEFCVFLKPELTELTDESFAKVWTLFSEKLKSFDVAIHGWIVIPGGVLSSTGAIQAHYGVIDAIARQGRVALSTEAERNLSSRLAGEWSDAEPLGAFQFLERFPFFTPTALAVLYDNLESNRLAGGSHGALADVRGSKYIIFNGFHPDQIERYTTSSAAIAVFWCSSSSSWRALRQEMTGATNPMRAASGSIRSSLLHDQATLGIPEFNSSMNGVHVSAGPVEGAVELVRYFSIGHPTTYADTKIGHALAYDLNLSGALVDELADNRLINVDGESVPIFDATEELDTEETLGLLRRSIV